MELTLLHRQILSDNSLDISSLPEGLQTKVNALEQKISDFEKSPTEQDKEKIETLSGKLAHAIKDYSENDRPATIEAVKEEVVVVPETPTEEQPPVIEQTETVANTDEQVSTDEQENEGTNQGSSFFQRSRIRHSEVE
jgi:hypothetical protein